MDTPVKMTQVESSMIHALGYDTETETLFVRFNNDVTWSYQPITAQGFNALLHAESIGKFFHANIRNNPDIDARKL